MMTEMNSPCELILKIGCNEYDEISTAITSLLRSCSILDEKFLSIERQIQPTTYFGSFTTQSSTLNIPIQCQSLSCVIFLTDELFSKQENKDFFKSIHLWNFHHKIELLNEYKQIIARQDYYELSYYLPLWSISNIPYNKQFIIRFNIFTKNFDLMLKFYENLFQRKPDSSKTGFVLFNLSTRKNSKLSYQLSIKYSPSIQSYSISQNAYLKFYLKNLNYFLHEYTSKLFTINKFEYYIYDPDGNLLHLYLQNFSSLNINECISSKSLIHTNDSGFGDSSSDPSVQFLHSNIYPLMKNNFDNQSYSSNDSGQCSSISSNELQTVRHHHHPISSVNNISVRSAKKSEMDYRLKQQQQKPVLSFVSRKPSLYESEPRLTNIINPHNRFYSSMINMKKFRPSSTNNFLKNLNSNDISYDVDSPLHIKNSSSYGYLNAFLLKKQQSIHSNNINQSEKPNIQMSIPRSKSTPLIDPLLSLSTKNISQRSIHNIKSNKLRSKSATFEWQNSNHDITSTDDDDDKKTNHLIDQIPNSRINIGITLDSRLRKTPVFDMLRSTTMQSDIMKLQSSNKTHSFIPIARF